MIDKTIASILGSLGDFLSNPTARNVRHLRNSLNSVLDQVEAGTWPADETIELVAVSDDGTHRQREATLAAEEAKAQKGAQALADKVQALGGWATSLEDWADARKRGPVPERPGCLTIWEESVAARKRKAERDRVQREARKAAKAKKVAAA